MIEKLRLHLKKKKDEKNDTNNTNENKIISNKNKSNTQIESRRKTHQLKRILIITHDEDDIPILFMVGKRDNQLYNAEANLQT